MLQRFEFTVCRDATESCRMVGLGEDIESAHMDAIARADTEGKWETDDWSGKPYIPDPDDYEEKPSL